MWEAFENQWIRAIWLVVVFVLWVMVVFRIWRRLKLEYNEEDILGFMLRISLIILAGGFGFGRAVFGKWEWVSGAGIAAGIFQLWRWTRSKDWDFWEWADELGPMFFAGVALLSVLISANNLIWAFVLGIGWLFTFWVRDNYRKFSWYKSGKLGFVGLFCLMWWTTAQIAVAIWKPGEIYWAGLTVRQWIAVWFYSASAVTLYLRAGRKISEDIPLWRKQKRTI